MEPENETQNDDSTGTDFTAGLPGTPGDSPAGDTSLDEAPAVGDDLAGGGGGDLNDPVGEPGDGGVTPDEEQEAGDGTEAPGEGEAGLSEGDLGAADDGDGPDETEAPTSDELASAAQGEDELRSAGEDELRAAPPTSGDNLPGQGKLHARMARAEATRGEAPFATPQMTSMVDTAPNGGTSVKAAVTTAEATQQAALNSAHATASAAAAAWRAERGIKVEDRYTRPITQQQD